MDIQHKIFEMKYENSPKIIEGDMYRIEIEKQMNEKIERTFKSVKKGNVLNVKVDNFLTFNVL